MVRYLSFAAASVVAAAVMFVSCQQGGSLPSVPAKVNFDEQKEAFSYMLGRDIGNTLKGLDTDVDLGIVFSAMHEVMVDMQPLVSDSVLRDIDQQFRTYLTEQREAKRKQQMEENKAAGVAFLEANKKVEGVQVTESGLQYIMIEEGTGDTPKAEDRVKVHYKGTLLDGTQFDSSYDRNEPTTFPLTGVIRGWTEGLQLMKTGGKARFFVPSELAYGERGARPPIGPNMTLIFEIELIEIVK